MSEGERGSDQATSNAPTGSGDPADLHQLLAAAEPRARAAAFFGVVPAGSVRRRPSDALHLVVAVAVVGASYAITDGFAPRADRLYRWLAGLPDLIGTAAAVMFVLSTVGAVVVVIGALLLTRNLRLAFTLTVLGGVTGVLAWVLAGAVHVDEVRAAAGAEGGHLFAETAIGLAIAVAVLLAVAPYLVRPVRRFVRLVTGVAVGAGILAAIGALGSIIGALGLGWAMSALASLVVGTPKATPTRGSVRRALEDLGVTLVDLELAGAQTWGETRFVGAAPDGAEASVVVIGRDATDARYFSKLWRKALYRDPGPSVSASRSSQLEHRAFLLLLAARTGVPVSDVVIAAVAGPEELAVLVLLEPDGEPFALLGHELDDADLDDAWLQLGRLHDARIAHGMIGPENLIRTADGSTAFLDFSRGSAGASADRRTRDRVDLLVTTAGLVGDERALGAAGRAVGDAGVAELLPLLESAALSPPARKGLHDRKRQLTDLREAGAAWSGVEVPELTQLRRVSGTSVAMAVATFVGFYLIVAQFSGVDLWATLQTADVAWVLVAFAISFSPNFFGTISVQGTVSQPLPFGPLLAEQFANNFTGLIGGTVANTALVIRFFQKQGLKVAIAASSGVMNGLANGIVEMTLVLFAVIFTDVDFSSSETGGGTSDLETYLLIGVVVVGVLVGLLVLVPKLRAAFQRIVGPQLAAAKANLADILTDPRQAVRIFGGNLCSQVAYALVIDAALHAYGASLPLATIIVINSVASLLGGAAPVPGGLGVIEAGLIAGMTAAGVEESVAVAATFTARLCTAYLPPIWGWFALGWLRRNDYV
ncbi:lysylphosphatidylglycerol synthase domain-containing protein [Aquihabitans daechungensis]|uniref:lysylphosphatidylglycerol synthase domain-containing protein n=1 Tax=Aquihabitans daechungensis TaxID=1052257 RepID=UPI003BA20DA8